MFAGLAEALGTRSVPWPTEAGDGSVGALVQALRVAHPELSSARFRVAVNQRYATDADVVGPRDEVALIPPVSGG